MAQPRHFTVFGERSEMLQNSEDKNFAHHIYPTQVVDVRESGSVHGYIWKGTPETGLVANGLIIGG